VHHPSLAVLLALMAPATARAVAAELELRGETGGGLDSNPQRTAEPGAPSDGFAFAMVQASGRLAGERFRAAGSLSEAGRLYLSVPGATAVASRLDVAARLALSPRLSAGAGLSASDFTERAHVLDESSLSGDGSLFWEGGGWGASASGGWRVFWPRDGPLRPYLASGPEAWLRAHWDPAPEHVLSAAYGFWNPGYPRWPDGGRDDRTHTVSGEYAHRGSFLAALGYAYSWNRSSASGGDFERHQLTGRGAVFLPLELTLAVRATLQWTHYPQLLSATQQLLLAQGQENQDALEARLTRALGESLDVALAFAFHGDDVGGAARGFSRTMVFATLGWRASWQRPRRGVRKRRREGARLFRATGPSAARRP
jgi:hypothetical protein